jgi:OOP family OmpA-OmpF porin
MYYIKITILFVVFFVSSIAVAGPAGPYLGVQGVYSDADVSESFISFDDNTFGFKLYGGYRFGVDNALDYFAIEASWQDLGEFDDNILGSNVELEVDGFTVDVLGFIPLSDRIELFGKIGYFDFEGDGSIDGIDFGSDDEDGLSLGFGIDSQIGRISVRGEFTWFDVDDIDLWTVGIGAQWNFGS